MHSIFKKVFLSILTILAITSCSKQLKNYEEFLDFAKPDSKLIRPPVIIVPGIKGSLLKRGDKEVWGKSYRVAFLNTFDELRLPIYEQLYENFRNKFAHFYAEKNVRDGGVMENYRIALPFLNLWDVSIYKNIKKVLIKNGGYHPDADLFMFSYDWRLDNRISAAKLSYRVKEIQTLYKNYLETVVFKDDTDGFHKAMEKFNKKGLLTEDGRVKVNLIAHSMGGLVSRYYIQALGGEDAVSKLIMLGTPNQGAMDALKAIAEGEFPESIFHFYFKVSTRPIIFSWPSNFQLLPRYPSCIKHEDVVVRVDHTNPGLGSPCNIINDDIGSDDIIRNWMKYNLIPPIGKTAGAETSPEILKQYLKEQLVSATKFFNTINGDIDEAYESKTLSDIKSFSKIASIDLDIEKKFINRQANTPIIVFGGHCEPTLTYVSIIKTKDDIEQLRFENPIKDKAGNQYDTMGDGRVPIHSLRFPSREIINDFQFLLCEGHRSLVSNTTFQYNLLQELLWQARSIN